VSCPGLKILFGNGLAHKYEYDCMRREERNIYTKEMHKIGHWGGIKEPDKCQKCVPE